ncbi:MAG TPA: helix-turn-helix domain-containing protein [Beijerinckiaceae bacterium]
MPRFLAEEVVARVRELYEGTALTHAKIAAETGVGASTVSVIAEREGWARHPEAKRKSRLEEERREAILRLREAGVPAVKIAATAGCHRNTVARIAPLRPAAAPWPLAGVEAGPVPERLADLHAALMSPDLRKAEAAPLLVRCAAALGAEALVRPDAQVERTAQALARLALRVAALPDEGPYAAAGADDRYRGPATFDETHELIEDLVRRYEAFAAREDAEAAAGPA